MTIEEYQAMSCEEINACIVEQTRQLALIDAQRSLAIRVADRAQAFVVDNCHSMQSWLRARILMSPLDAHNALLLARKLDQLPVVEEAFVAGRIGSRQVTQVVRLARELGVENLVEHQGILVSVAEVQDPCTLGRAFSELRYTLDPDGALEGANEIHGRRYLDLHQTFGDVFHIQGMLDPEAGATLQTALYALMGPPAADDTRTNSQRRADALLELARRRLDAGDLPSAGGVRPHLSVMASIETLRLEPGSLPARLGWADLIHGETARRLACDCTGVAVIVDSDGEPLDVGRASRFATRRQKRALHVRDGGCGMPDCDLPPEWCEAHHIDHWINGGYTAAKRMVLLCRRHHRLVHEGRWKLDFGPNRKLVATPPWAQQTA